MEALLAGLEAWPPVEALRTSVWVYPALNALHILGLALLVGGILPLDLRRLGAWSGVAADGLERVLTLTAAVGLGTAALTGLALFSVSARDYAALDVFWVKMALVALGTLNALWTRRRFAAGRGTAGPAVVSAVAWLGALGLGRAIGYLM